MTRHTPLPPPTSVQDRSGPGPAPGTEHHLADDADLDRPISVDLLMDLTDPAGVDPYSGGLFISLLVAGIRP